MSPVRDLFRVAARTRANGLVDVTRYVLVRSGLTVTIADVEGPLVGGHLSVVTETNTDEGLPHTLEHLVFLGSKKYPYKGVLDVLANRCLASGTNAWTAQDHTCYTLSTAGQDGFLKLLPIYLDHVLKPLLTDSGFVTEVHHINESGEDAGVVYSEMQAYEGEMNCLTGWKLQELAYPPGCSYGVETGGRLHDLRTTCNNQKVREFHSRFYQPKNLQVVVTGQVDHERVLECVTNYERQLLESNAENTDLKKPFRTDIEQLKESKEAEVLCPAEDLSRGSVRIGYGAHCANDICFHQALLLMADYLTDTAISPLQQDFVQIADPLCSSVSCCIYEQWRSAVVFVFNGVPVDKLASIKPKFLETLQSVFIEKDFDMQRMQALIKQTILRYQNELETSPHDSIPHTVIGDQLYAEENEQFHDRLNVVSILKSFLEKESAFWLSILSKYLSPTHPFVCVIGRPSAEFVETTTKEENERINRQKQKLGESGLQKCGSLLEAAIEENEESQPDDALMDECIVNSLDGIKFVSLQQSDNLSSKNDTNANFKLSKMPVTALLDDCKTNFVEIAVLLDTEKLPDALRPYILVWTELLFESALLNADGSVQPYEQVVKELNADLVGYSAALGVCSKFRRIVTLNIKVDKNDYEKGVSWLRKLLFSIHLSPDRVRVALQKLLSSAVACKRDGYKVARFILGHLMYEPESNPRVHSVLCQEKFLKRQVERLDSEPQKVLAELQNLMKHFKATENLTVHIMCKTDQLPCEPAAPWTCFSPADDQPSPKRLKRDVQSEPLYLRADTKGLGAILPVASCESAFVLQSVPSISDCNHPDLPALMLFLQYVDQCEGPLYREIRGKGLAYGANVFLRVDDGFMSMVLYRCSQPLQAYEETKRIVERLLDATDKLEQFEFDAAKRSLVFEIIDREETVSAASAQSLLSYYRRVPCDYNRQFCEKIWGLSITDLLPVARKYVPDLFDASLANTAVTCHPSKLDEITTGFGKFGKSLKSLSIEDAELYI